MRRVQLFQFTEQPWFPGHLTTLVHEFLLWFIGKVGAAKPFLPVLEEALQHTASSTIFDLELGPGSGLAMLQDALPSDVTVNRLRVEDFTGQSAGVYTVANGFHRLPVEQAQDLLSRIAGERRTVVIVEGNNDNWWQAVGMLVFAPISALLTAPLVRPFRWSRLLFTYLIPILPLIIAFDGAAALFKLYPPKDLDELFAKANISHYSWRSGKYDNGRGGKIIYAIGYPEAEDDSGGC